MLSERDLEEKKTSAWLEYVKVHERLLDKYEKIQKPAWAEYVEARSQAWAEYELKRLALQKDNLLGKGLCKE